MSVLTVHAISRAGAPTAPFCAHSLGEAQTIARGLRHHEHSLVVVSKGDRLIEAWRRTDETGSWDQGCVGPSHTPGDPCGRPARVFNPAGLCATHYQQQRRGRALRPIGGNGPRVRLPGMLVSPECAAALEKNGPTVYEAARAVLERWAERRGQDVVTP